MRKLLLPILLIVSISIFAQKKNESAVVLELFTSQGCSSCPSADKLLDVIKKEYTSENIFVLSYHVDYWNRLGWKDPFSSLAYSDYQREYAYKFNSRSLYTPQLVVNGNIHFTGSDRNRAVQSIQTYKKQPSLAVISLTNGQRKKSEIQFDYKVIGKRFDRITLTLVVSERDTKVSRGENRSRILKNSNIVANRIVKREDSGSVSIQIPEWVSEKDELSIIAYTQNNKLGTTGASKMSL